MTTFWQFVQAEATVNLISNPSLEVNASGYSAANGATLARSSDQRAVGLYSLKITPTAATDDGAYFAVSLATTTEHTFSVSVRGVDGVPYRIYLYDVTAGVILGSAVEFTGDGTWRRQVVAATTGANASCRVYVVKNNSASTTPFYIDALQLEAKGYATTYCDGDQDGCQWNAGEHTSTSSRDSQSAAGGRVIDLDESDYLRIQDHVGVGQAPLEIIDTLPAQGDGGDFQRSIVRPRQFQLNGVIQGTGTGGLAARKNYHTKRGNLIAAFNRDRLATEQPVQIRYRLDGKSAAIDALQQGGLEKGAMEDSVTERVSLRFKAENPFWRAVMGVAAGDGGGGAGGGQGSVIADVQESIANADHIIKRAANGQWAAMGTGLTGPSPGNPNAVVEAVVVGPDGCIYIGGQFTSVGGVANTAYIAKWDGAVWSALGTGANGTVSDLAFDGDGNLIAVGSFTQMSGVANTNRVAKWDGSSWTAMGGGGASGDIKAVVYDPVNDLIYIGGLFTNLDGNADCDYIAFWNSGAGAWDNLTTGTNDQVWSLAVDSQGNLYVGGLFSLAGGVANTNCIAKWNGSAWSALGTGKTGGAGVVVYGIGIDSQDNIYAGGSFTEMGGVADTLRVAKWNGSAWSAMGTGATGGDVYGLFANSSDEIYVVGSFTALGGVADTAGIGLWDGSSWQALGGGGLDSGLIWDIQILNDGTIYVGGVVAIDAAVSYVILYDGVKWRSIAREVKRIFQATDGKIYVGGGFSQAGGVANTLRVAYWDPVGESWNAMGTGVNGFVYAIAEAPNGDIYVAGAFTQAGGVASTQGIAYWDGSNWNSIGDINGVVFSLAFAPDGTLYIGGVFKDAGGVANTVNLATWDGSSFGAISTGANGAVNALAFDTAGNLFLGGAFTALGGVACNYLGKWDGTTFTAVASGTNGYVNVLIFMNDGSLILAGVFTQAGGGTVNYAARWNGSSFSALAGGLNAAVYCGALSATTGKLYLGGIFTTAGGVSLPDRAAVYLGTIWAPLTVDLPGDAVVEALLVTPTDQIFVGFDTTGTAIAAAVN